MNISNKGIEAIKIFESLHDGDLHQIGLQPKMCPAGYWTEGYGALVLTPNGNKLKGISNKSLAYKYSKIHNEEQAVIALKKDLSTREKMIDSLHLNLKQGQFDALVDFIYNLGFTSLLNSTLLKRIKTNINDVKGISEAFLMWVKSNGNTLPGLVNRRKKEIEWFFE